MYYLLIILFFLGGYKNIYIGMWKNDMWDGIGKIIGNDGIV